MARLIALAAVVLCAGCHAPRPSWNMFGPLRPTRVPPPSTNGYQVPKAGSIYYERNKATGLSSNESQPAEKTTTNSSVAQTGNTQTPTSPTADSTRMRKDEDRMAAIDLTRTTSTAPRSPRPSTSTPSTWSPTKPVRKVAHNPSTSSSRRVEEPRRPQTPSGVARVPQTEPQTNGYVARPEAKNAVGSGSQSPFRRASFIQWKERGQ